MCLGSPLADANEHFAPVSTMKSPDAVKQISKILLGLLYHLLNCQQPQRTRHVWAQPRAAGQRDRESSSLSHGWEPI